MTSFADPLVPSSVDVDSPAARALREIQMLDEALGGIAPGARRGDTRSFIIRAEDALGALLGLECAGVLEDSDLPSYEHDGGTCPIHEWLVPADQPTVEERIS